MDRPLTDVLNDAGAAPSQVGIATTLLVAAVARPLERLFPADRRGYCGRGRRLDLAYWFFTPLFTKVATNWLLAGVLLVAFVASGRPLDATLLDGYGPLARQPVWLQTIEIVVLADFIDYWTHRAFHSRRLWRFHAAHHSPEEMTWLSAGRMHPVNDAVTRVCQVVPLALLGFSGAGVALVVPYLVVYVIFLHANLRWDFGPFRYVLVSPAYHRWHHATDPDGIDKNFAGVFPVWDVLFGTYYFPRRLPERYGVAGDDPPPETLIGQLLYPLRRGRPGEATDVDQRRPAGKHSPGP